MTSSANGWFKSSYSSDAAACVEVRFDGERILIRDSKFQGRAESGPVLVFTPAEWSAFTAVIRADRISPLEGSRRHRRSFSADSQPA